MCAEKVDKNKKTLRKIPTVLLLSVRWLPMLIYMANRTDYLFKKILYISRYIHNIVNAHIISYLDHTSWLLMSIERL